MEKFKKFANEILINHDKERTMIIRLFDSYVARNGKIECKGYGMFILGFGIGASLLYIMGEFI